MGGKNTLYWGSVINKSFYYTEYTAYEINKVSQGIVLTKWEKTNNQEDASVGRAERIFLKTEWILPVINLIRSIPKNELDRGTDDSSYGEWDRRISLYSDNSEEECETRIVFRNRDYERSLPKLEIYIYSDKKEKLSEELAPYKVYEDDRLNNIYLSHGYNFEGYIEYIEPILIELEKYVPEEDCKKINPPLGKPKTELEKITESYERKISKYPQDKNEPYIAWIKNQTENNYYDITALVFFKGKLNYQKTISCSVYQMAMIKKYFEQWYADIKTLPYTKENIDLKIEISEKAEYKNYLSAKIYIDEEDDYFELPVSASDERNPFYELCSFTEAEKIHTHYLRALNAFIENDNLVLKWYDDNSRICEDRSHHFFIEKTQAAQFLKLFKELENIYLFWQGDFGGEYISHPDVFLEYGYRQKGDFEFGLPGSTALHVTDFYVKNNKIKGLGNLLSLQCFGEDFISELGKIIKCVEKVFLENPDAFDKKNYEKVDWKHSYHYDGGEYYEHYFIWQFEGQNKIKKIKLKKELIYRIEEYSFWWWQATDHKEKLTFSDERLFLEINPTSDKTGLGTVEIKIKRFIGASVKAYFDLSDGNNLPKSFYGSDLKEWIVRKVEVNKNPDLKSRASFFSKKDKIKPSNYICINYYESKYFEIEKNEAKFWAIEKRYFNDFKNSLNEIYEYLKNKKNKISKLLAPEEKNKYDKDGYHITIFEQRLEVNGKVNLKPDEYIPLDITIYSKAGFDSDPVSIVGSRKILLWQLEIVIAALNSAL